MRKVTMMVALVALIYQASTCVEDSLGWGGSQKACQGLRAPNTKRLAASRRAT
jgi:hypothetical protein